MRKEKGRFGLGDLILSLHRDRYTGLVILHLAEGTPKKAEFPGRQIPLATGPEANTERKSDDPDGTNVVPPSPVRDLTTL